MPNLGIIASSISGNLWAPGKDYDSIATVTLGTSTASITFSSIPQTYRHLQIRMLSTSGNTPSSGSTLRYNGDTTVGNYYAHNIQGDGATAAAYATASNSYFPAVLGNAATTGPAGGILDILDYTNTNKYKTSRYISSYDQNGSGYVVFGSNLWSSTAAITSIVLTGNANFAQYTQAALYGVK
jgi:hypothetical protein